MKCTYENHIKNLLFLLKMRIYSSNQSLALVGKDDVRTKVFMRGNNVMAFHGYFLFTREILKADTGPMARRSLGGTRHNVHFSTQRWEKRSPKLVQTHPQLGVLQWVPRPA